MAKEQAPLVDQEVPPDKGEGGNFLTKKLGPLPVWAYIVVGGGAIAFLWYRSQNGNTSGIPIVGDASSGSGGSSDSGSSSSDMSGVQAQISAMGDQVNQALTAQNQSQQAQSQALAQTFNQELQQEAQSFTDAIGQVTQQQQQQGQGFATALQQLQENFQQSLAQQGEQMQAGFAQVQNAQSQQMATVKNILGQMVQVPAAVAAAGSRPGPQGQSGGYVAGTHPASASSPAGGGTWQGQNDQQIQQLFQNTYGSNWQNVWNQQHAAQVAQNGG